MKKIPMPWLILLFSAYAHSADYFKCRDPDGGIRYTDRLCSATGSEYIGIKKKQLPVTSDTMERADGKERQANKVLEKKGFSETVAKVSPEIVEAEKTIEPKKSFVQGVFDKIRSFLSPSSKVNGDSPSVGNPMATNVETKSAYPAKGKPVARK